MKNNAAVLIPAFQPDEKLVAMIEKLKIKDFNVFVVDDGSDAVCSEIFEQVKALGAVVITHEKNRGKGAALKTGLKYIYDKGFSIAVTADSDGQHTVSDIEKLIDKALLYPEKLILGVRNVNEMPPRSKFGNSLTCKLFDAMYGIKISDTQTGLRAIPINKDNIDILISLNGDRYEYEMNMLIISNELFNGIIEVPIETIYIDNNDSSHFRPIRDGAKIYAVIFKHMPVFLIASLSSFVIDYILFAVFIIITANNSILATVFARIISGGANYTFNKFFVFKRSKSYTFLKYLILAVIILAINCGLMFIAADLLHIPALVAKIFIELILYILSFILQNRFAHKNISA